MIHLQIFIISTIVCAAIGQKPYYLPDEMCCHGAVFKRIDKLKCCWNQTYNPDTQICCDKDAGGTMAKPIQSSSSSIFSFFIPQYPTNYGCCNGKAIDLSKSICCNGRENSVSSSFGFFSSGYQCCGTSAYSPISAACCGGKVFNGANMDCCGSVGYSTLTQVCCGGSIIAKKANQDCCGGKLYDSIKYYCDTSDVYVDPVISIRKPNFGLLDTRYNMPDQIYLATCGDFLYYKSYSKTDKTNTVCCNGTLHYLPKDQDIACCGNVLYSRQDEVCCQLGNGNIKTRKKFQNQGIGQYDFTCGYLFTDPFDRTTEDVCNGKVIKKDPNAIPRSEICCKDSMEFYAS